MYIMNIYHQFNEFVFFCCKTKLLTENLKDIDNDNDPTGIEPKKKYLVHFIFVLLRKAAQF